MEKRKLIAGLLIKNEADRYLRKCLDDLVQYVDGFVVVDNGSTDDSVKICQSYEKCLVVQINSISWQTGESTLRQELFNLICKYNPEWVLIIDGDEIFEEKFKQLLPKLMNSQDFDWYGFKIFHFWGNETFYRIDKLWRPHNGYIRMCRYKPNFDYIWADAVAGSPLPTNVHKVLMGKKTKTRIKHLGYANQEDIKRKFDRYINRNDEHQKEHIKSILDKEIVLEKWLDS